MKPRLALHPHQSRAKRAGVETQTRDGQGEEATQAALFRFVGSDDDDTDSFQVDQDWRVVSETGGRPATIERRSIEGACLDTIGNHVGSGLGRSEIQAPGSYTLALRDIGDWQVRIVSAESDE
jgi:hypothetical protein